MADLTPFAWNINPGRILFGAGAVSRLAEEIRAAGRSRVLLLTTPFQKDTGEALAASLPGLVCGVFAEAAMHTPVEVTERALRAFNDFGADATLALGGGSTIGLGKAIAWRNDAMQFVVATTYAGSEVTNILGETSAGLKTTVRGPKILPEVVIYDPELTLTLPVGMSVTSGLNAMAHAIEGLYAQDRNPVMSLIAVEGIRALRDALPAIVAAPQDGAARGQALYGSWLCGTVLGAVGMALHHKLCHTLGGSFDLPHAETHAVLIPHTAAFNEAAAHAELAPAAALFGGNLGGGLWAFAKSIGAPLSLRDLGLKEADLDRAAEIAVKNPYWNPRPIDRNAIRALLGRAWAGDCPEYCPELGAELKYFTEETSVDAVNVRMGDDINPRLRQVMASLVKHLHAFAKDIELRQDEWDFAIDFLTRTGQICSDERQEFILLSDTLGLSMLVDAMGNRRPTGATENTVFGPFHVEGAPVRAMGDTICLDGKGESCLFTGRVIDIHGKPIMGARVDVWSDNAEGFYSVQQPGIQDKWNNRGIFVTGADGKYEFRGIKPVSYPIPDDGPVGKMLAALGRHPNRPAHMHFLVTAPGFQKLVTHTFVGDDPWISSDAVFGVKATLVAPFEHVRDGKTEWRSPFDFVMTPLG